MSTSHKKVIVRLKNGVLHRGYLSAGRFVVLSAVDLLLLDGKAVSVPLGEVLHIAYVRDFNLDDRADPERVGFRSFPSKPRIAGIWVRVHFAEGDTLEGLIREDGLALIDAVLHDSGVFMEPPNPRGNTQKFFVPRSAMEKFEILSVSGGPAAKRRPDGESHRQAALFDLEADRAL